MSERRFALMKVAPGDYLLPGNDERSLWRIAQYRDGESFGLDMTGDRTYWGAWLYTRRVAALALLPEDYLEWDHWQMQASSLLHARRGDRRGRKDDGVNAVPTLEDMAQKIADARERLASAEREVEEKKAPYFAAVGRASEIQREVESMEQAMESSKRAHMTLRAIEDASLTYDAPLVIPVEVYRGYDMYFLVAIGQDGTGLYLHTPKRSHRYQGKVHAVLVEQARSHGVESPSSSYRKMTEAGLMEWQKRGKGDFGDGSGAMKPLPPPEGGRWKWLKVREQDALEAA